MSDFTRSELDDIAAALRLRAESAEDNGELAEARKWRRILEKVEGLQAKDEIPGALF